MKNIVLTGFMGAGKSSVGRILAKRTGYTFCDLDALITKEAGISINDIFSRHGEQYFRRLETDIIKGLEAEDRLVIATGGGAVISSENRRLLHSMGCIVNLMAQSEDVIERLSAETDRPLLNDDRSHEKVREMLREREPFYADADIRIDTTGKKVEDIAAEIMDSLKGKL